MQNHLFGHRSTNVLNTIFSRTSRYRNSFYPDSVIAWNRIGHELRGAKSVSVFKTNILNIIRPVKKGLLNIHDPKGIKFISVENGFKL